MPNRHRRPRLVGRHSADQIPASYRNATRDLLAYNDAARSIEGHLQDAAQVRRALDLIDALSAHKRITIADASARVTAEVLSRPRRAGQRS